MIKKILLFVASVVFSSFAYCDGTCTLIQHGSGYTIRCEGDGIQVNYVDITNEVYIIENCNDLKNQLKSTVNSIASSLWDSYYGLDSVRGSIESVSADISFLQDSPPDSEVPMQSSQVASRLNSLQSNVSQIQLGIENSINALNGQENSNSLIYQIDAITCGSCESSGGDGGSGDCCSVDLNPILDRLNAANGLLGSSTNILNRIYDLFSRQFDFENLDVTGYNRYPQLHSYDVGGQYNFRVYPGTAYYPTEETFINLLFSLHDNLADSLPSLNNYFYQLVFQQIPVITNQFSFFINEITSDSPLYYYRPSEFGSYYSYLTNHYVNSAFKNFGSGASGERGLTNWFQRIETLIAALVFSDDGSSTNTVDSSYGQSQQNQIISSLSSLTSVSGSQLSTMSEVGNGLVDSLRILNNSFQQFASLPSDVELVRFSSNTRSAETVSFQLSEIIYLVDSCRCVTTLAWCVGGVWLLFIFVSWTVKQSYGLAVFCWSVLSGVFHH